MDVKHFSGRSTKEEGQSTGFSISSSVLSNKKKNAKNIDQIGWYSSFSSLVDKKDTSNLMPFYKFM